LETHPTLRMMTRTPADLRRKAMALRRQASARAPAHLQLDVIECASSVGGGALPGVDLPSFALALTSTEWSADQLAARLRHSDPPIIARIERDAVLLDMRTLLEGDDSHIIAALDQLE
jgi:L-seryl-tRNA(Ser) seleniumtransferase